MKKKNKSLELGFLEYTIYIISIYPGKKENKTQDIKPQVNIMEHKQHTTMKTSIIMWQAIKAIVFKLYRYST